MSAVSDTCAVSDRHADVLRLFSASVQDSSTGEVAYLAVSGRIAALIDEVGLDETLLALEEVKRDSPDLFIFAGAADCFLKRGDPKASNSFAQAAFSLSSSDPYVGRLIEKSRRRLLGISVDKRKFKGFCQKPFEHFETGPDGSAFLCCSGWLPKAIGNIKEQSWTEIWNSTSAQEIRRSIHDGSYKFCNPVICPVLASGALIDPEVHIDPSLKDIVAEKTEVLESGPRLIHFSHDGSCNLACPTCRKEKYVARGKEKEDLQKLSQIILPLINDTSSCISMTGSGDPFASQHFRYLIKHMKKREKATLDLQTNGLLFDERAWRELDLDGKVRNVLISMDASSPEVYSVVRRYGDFSRLMTNLRFIADLRRQGKIRNMRLDYVVQSRNYKDMPGFASIGSELGVDVVSFNGVTNWGTFTPEEFAQQIIWSPEHPELPSSSRFFAR